LSTQRITAWVQAVLSQPAAEGADGARIADTAVATWRGVELALAPIIGMGGVAALYKRSLYLTRREFPWLDCTYAGDFHSEGLGRLQTALSQQAGVVAAAANGALLRTFCDLLTNLLGASLTERLLRSVWEDPSGGHTDQDNSR
jgi:hypothetical protein